MVQQNEKVAGSKANPILEYLKAIRSIRMSYRPQSKPRFCGNEDLVLQHGVEFVPDIGQINPNMPDYPRACYYNAYTTVARSRSLKYVYVEGWAISGGLPIPVQHAWLALPGSNIAIDPTWKDPDAVYFGIPFRRDYVVPTIRQHKRRQCFSLLEAIHARYPLLTGETPIENVKM